MSDALADTGPILHLHEIGRLQMLRVFDSLLMPDLVADEIRAYGLEPTRLGVAGQAVTIESIAEQVWKPLVAVSRRPMIHPADAQVFALAHLRQFAIPVLTDDLGLRRRLEEQRATVVGSVGVLVRAYSKGWLERVELENAIEALLTQSTLHASRAFVAYTRALLNELLNRNEPR